MSGKLPMLDRMFIVFAGQLITFRVILSIGTAAELLQRRDQQARGPLADKVESEAVVLAREARMHLVIGGQTQRNAHTNNAGPDKCASERIKTGCEALHAGKVTNDPAETTPCTLD